MEVKVRARTGRVHTSKHICDVTLGGGKGKSQNREGYTLVNIYATLHLVEVRVRARTGRVQTSKHICDVTFGGGKGKSQNREGTH